MKTINYPKLNLIDMKISVVKSSLDYFTME